MIKISIIIFCILLISSLFIISCKEEMKSTDNTKKKQSHYTASSHLSYPYHASKEREEIIHSNWMKIKIGMTRSDVISILGRPDQIHSLYEPQIKTGKQIGHTHWYLIQRLKENGSVRDKDEKLVRISYDKQGNVIGVDKWGF